MRGVALILGVIQFKNFHIGQGRAANLDEVATAFDRLEQTTVLEQFGDNLIGLLSK